MMRPLLREIISGSAHLQQWKAPSTCTANICRHASGVMSVKSASCAIPALLTTTSMGPKAARARANISCTCAASATSAAMAMARAGMRESSCSVFSAASARAA